MAGNGKGFRIFSNIVLAILTIFAVAPFVLMFVSSITEEGTIMREGYSFIPRNVDFSAYKYLLTGAKGIVKAYGMTILVTVIGTIANMALTMALGYLLSKQDLPGRNFLSFFVFFTMLFSGGMVPSYIIWSRVFKVSETFFGLLLPNLLMSPFNVILMRTYFTTNVPKEILEAAEMDSCSQVGMLFRICIPLSKPMIATIALFSALAYWNDWVNGMYYLIRRNDLSTIQYVLNKMQNQIDFFRQTAEASKIAKTTDIPSLGVRMAIAVVSILPILMVYPFFQRQFVRGIVVGGVKG